MKYAVLSHSTTNIGDDIQTVAAIEWLRKKGENVSIAIDRESLSEYTGEQVKLIMNGWFMHNIDKFPPSSFITPIFIGFHADKETLIENNISYLKKHSPIGCRDLWTLKLCEKFKIPAFLSGCLTLTLENQHADKSNAKLLVDVNNNISYIPNIDSLNTSFFSGFQHITHEISKTLSHIERLNLARDLIQQYSVADMVVTTRLHCVLVCRSLRTPCVFIHKDYYTDNRFSGLHEILNGHDVMHEKSQALPDALYNLKNLLNSIFI